jgi:hypothetical protein
MQEVPVEKSGCDEWCSIVVYTKYQNYKLSKTSPLVTRVKVNRESANWNIPLNSHPNRGRRHIYCTSNIILDLHPTISTRVYERKVGGTA